MNYMFRFVLMALFIIPTTFALMWLLGVAKSSCPRCMPWIYLIGTAVVAGCTGILGYTLYRQHRLALVAPFVLASLTLAMMTASKFLEGGSASCPPLMSIGLTIGLAAIISAMAIPVVQLISSR